MSTERMRILMIVFNRRGMGTYWRAWHLGKELVRRGHAVTLMVTAISARFSLRERQVEGLQVVETPDLFSGSWRSGWDLWGATRRMLWLRGREFDLVHAFETRPAVIFPALVARRRGARLFLDWCDWFGRGGSVEERTNPLLRGLLRPVETFFENHYRTLPEGTTVINTFLQQRAIRFGLPPERVLLLRNGSELDVPVMPREEARRELNLPEKDLLIGFVGRTFPRDAEFMAASFNRVLQAVPQAKLLLVGRFNRAIEELVDEPAAVIRTGPVDYRQIYPYLSACDLCWLPLRDSGANRGRWPLKLNDYMSAGRAVVATDVGDLGEVVSTYHLGVVSPDSPEAFAAATLALWRDSPPKKMLEQAARHAAETVFSWRHLTDRLEAFYCQVLQA